MVLRVSKRFLLIINEMVLMAFKGPEQFFNGLLEVLKVLLNFYNLNIL